MTPSLPQLRTLTRLGACAFTLLSACPGPQLSPLTPCSITGTTNRIRVRDVAKADIVFLVDNSGSMASEQIELGRRIEPLVRSLTSGDRDGDGVQDFTPVEDVHLALLSSDLGTGQADSDSAGTCQDLDGDDGAFQARISKARAACADAIPPSEPYLSFGAGSDAVDLSASFRCLVESLGISGCGFEQQLESVLKALTPSSSELRFAPGPQVTGVADSVNAGFRRPDALLSVILVTDEDDCSASDLSIFDPSNARFFIDGKSVPNLRCQHGPFAGALHPISRYADGLLALVDRPDLLVFGVIAGIPPELEGQSPSELLASDALQPQPIRDSFGSLTGELAPACSRKGQSATPETALPPTRLVETARELESRGASTVVTSICNSDLSSALGAITARVVDAVNASCLDRPQNRDAQGMVQCSVIETLPEQGEFTRCAQLAREGRTLLRREADGRESCVVTQIAVDAQSPSIPVDARGWYYDDFSTETLEICAADTPQRITFTEGAEPRLGAELRLDCQARSNSTSIGAEGGLGDSCLSDQSCGAGNFCDPRTERCQRACNVDADCEALGAFACDTRPLAAGFPAMCVNVTCPNS